MRVLKIGVTKTRMVSSVSLGNQHLHRLADKFLSAIPKNALGLGVNKYDFSVHTDNNHGIWRRFQYRLGSWLLMGILDHKVPIKLESELPNSATNSRQASLVLGSHLARHSSTTLI